MQKLVIDGLNKFLYYFKNGLSVFKENFNIHSFSIGLDIAFFLSLLVAGSYLCLFFVVIALIKILILGYFNND